MLRRVFVVKSTQRCHTGSGISFRVEHARTLNAAPIFRYAKRAIVQAKDARMTVFCFSLCSNRLSKPELRRN